MVSDGTNTSTAQTSTITVTAANDPAMIDNAGGTLTYTESDGAQIIDSSLTLSDVDDTHIESASIIISSGFTSGEDTLSFTDTANISGSYNVATGVLTLTGSDTLANYEAALESIRYNNSSANPNTGNRPISWVVNDCTNASAVKTSTITVAAVDDDAPVLDNLAGTLTYTEDDGAQVIDNDITISDVDDTHIESATISISGGFTSGEDTLNFTNTANISGS